MDNKTEHRVLHLLDPGIFQCTTVRYVPAQKSVPLQLMWLLCYSSHCQRPANNKWSQHSAHKSHLNIGRVKWIHPFSLPTSFNWCLWVELNTGCCRCSSFSAFFVGTCDNLTDHSTPIVPGILIIFFIKSDSHTILTQIHLRDNFFSVTFVCSTDVRKVLKNSEFHYCECLFFQ